MDANNKKFSDMKVTYPSFAIHVLCFIGTGLLLRIATGWTGALLLLGAAAVGTLFLLMLYGFRVVFRDQSDRRKNILLSTSQPIVVAENQMTYEDIVYERANKVFAWRAFRQDQGGGRTWRVSPNTGTWYIDVGGQNREGIRSFEFADSDIRVTFDIKTDGSLFGAGTWTYLGPIAVLNKTNNSNQLSKAQYEKIKQHLMSVLEEFPQTTDTDSARIVAVDEVSEALAVARYVSQP